jgi:hypothetical protein
MYCTKAIKYAANATNAVAKVIFIYAKRQVQSLTFMNFSVVIYSGPSGSGSLMPTLLSVEN